MIKCKDGRRTCSCFCTSRNYELGADTVNKSLAIVDEDDYTIAEVAYVRGLENHPHSAHSDTINNMVEALFLTETPDPPIEETTTDDSQNSESDYAPDRPDSPRGRCASSTNNDLLDESSDDEIPPYTVQPLPDAPPTESSPQPGPSGLRTDTFAAILAATRNAARQQRVDPPGDSTQEAPPAQPTPPAALQPEDHSEQEDDAPSPLHTRSGAGAIRRPPAAPKKTKRGAK